MSQTSYPEGSASSKIFKIRKTRPKLMQEIQQREQVTNLQDLRLADNLKPKTSDSQKQKTEKIQPKQYLDDQQDINCYRYPHSSYCGCDSNCMLESFQPIQIMSNLYYGNFVCGLKTRHMLELGITHVLNVTSKQFTQRTHYFDYLNIDLHYNAEQDAKKFYRLSNRFIRNAISKGGKVLIHSSVLELGAVMVMGYLIGIQKIPFKQGLQIVMKNGMEISPHFLKQIESYDLQKMAFVSIQRQ